MRLRLKAKIESGEDSYRITTNWDVESNGGEPVTVEADSLTEAKKLFRKKMSEIGVDSKAYTFTMNVRRN